MLFRKNKQHSSEEQLENNERLALTSLIPLCNGQVYNDTFIIEDYDIYVYADVVSLKDDVVQIVYQLHHELLEEPIVESVAASGDTLVDALHKAAQSFYENILAVYIEALTPSITSQKIHVVLQDYYVHRGKINGIGRREGILEGDLWDMLQDDIISYIRDEKVYWIRVFTSKNKDNIICEVKINGNEISALSEKMLAYAESWDCIDSYHTEKQGILLMQVNKEIPLPVEPQMNRIALVKQAIELFEKCKSNEEYRNIRKAIFVQCKDESLVYELYSLLPEFYCMFAYAKVEFGDIVYLVRKGESTKEISKDQLSSYESIRTCVFHHLMSDNVSRNVIENVLQYSVNARAIQKALAQGDAMEELMVPGVGIRIPQNYKIK